MLDACVTSGVLPYAVTRPIHGFRTTGQPLAVLIRSSRISRVLKSDPLGFVAGMTRKWDSNGSEWIEILDGNRDVQTTIILKVPCIAEIF